jgi:hypothetical protein
MCNGLFYTNTSFAKCRVYYTGTKLFSNLPPTAERLNHDVKAFKPALKYCFLTHSFCVNDLTSICEIRLLTLKTLLYEGTNG